MSSPCQDTPPTPRSPSAQSEDSVDPPPHPDIGPELGPSDLTLHCRNEIWYLHRAPLCAKSRYFRKKEEAWKKKKDEKKERHEEDGEIDKEDEESCSNYLVIDTDDTVDPDALWIVVEFCYHGRLDLDAACPDHAPFSPTNDTRLERSMLLWAAAEQLQVAGLKEALWAQVYGSPFFFERPGANRIISVSTVFRVIRIVYKYTPEPRTLALRIVTQNMASQTNVPEQAADALVRAHYGDGYEHLYRRKAMRERHLLFRWLAIHFNAFELPVSTFTRDLDQFRFDVETGQGKCPFCKQRWALDLQSARITEQCSTCGALSTVDVWAYHDDIVFRYD